MRIIFATGNQSKMIEIRGIMAHLGMEILSMKDAGIKVDIEENGSSFEENAKIKTRALGVMPDTIVMADDSGLSVDALNGEPGIYSARYLGPDATPKQMNQSIIDRLRGVTTEKRGAAFICAISILFPDGTEAVTFGEMRGRIAEKPAGCGGFGYDPILYLPEYGKTVAELPEEEKNRISHRGKALENAEKCIREWTEKHPVS